MGIEEGKQKSEASKLLTRRKCKRCETYYTLQEMAEDPAKAKCRFHPGHYVEPICVTQGTQVGWSCCVQGPELGLWGLHLVNDPALERSCQGCEVADQHEEDWEYTNNILCFPIDIEAAKNANNTQNTPTPTNVASKKSLSETQRNNFIVHPISRLDTLMGLSLRYNVSIDELKRVNQLTSQNISHLDEILIPLLPNQNPEVKKIQLTPQQERDQLVRTFKNKTGVPVEEAKFYLEEANYNFEVALHEFQADNQWEVSGKRKAVVV